MEISSSSFFTVHSKLLTDFVPNRELQCLADQDTVSPAAVKKTLLDKVKLESTSANKFSLFSNKNPGNKKH